MSHALIQREARVCAANYSPVPVMMERALDVWLWDTDGRRYLDLVSAYSAVNHGHLHPRLVAALTDQLGKLSLTSRAMHSAPLAPFLEELCRVSGFARALPMNTGAEAVETAIKALRRWAYRVKGIAPGEAQILVARDNFHGRTTTLVGFSSQDAYRDGFGPFTPGFGHFDFGDLASLDAAATERTCAVLMEPIQGEAGVVVPPEGYLRAVREWCDRRGVLLVIDEIQSGLGRTGRMFAFEHEDIRPDGILVGKALGGGLLPVSVFLADAALMDVFDPGSHGSTFGGNALAARVGLEALRVLAEERLVQRSAELGAHLIERLRSLPSKYVLQVRGKGLWAGVVLAPGIDASVVSHRLLARGIVAKDTHGNTIRIAPALTVQRGELDWAVEQLAQAMAG